MSVDGAPYTIIEHGAINKLSEVISKMGLHGRVLVVTDTCIHSMLGDKIKAQLPGAAFCVLQAGGHADEPALGAALIDASSCDYLVAVGSGTVNDVARFVGYMTHKPFVAVATAPSMDGYASSVSPLIVKGYKSTYDAAPPIAIIGDLDVLVNAPAGMIAAGLGDVLGKHVALMDWRLGELVTGEVRHIDIVEFMEEAVAACERSAGRLKGRDPEAVSLLLEGLIQSGEAIRRNGNSRPASGAEHHISHFWEMRQLQRGDHAALHGDKVGVATLLVLDMYERFFEKRPALGKDIGNRWIDDVKKAYGVAAPPILAEHEGVTYDREAIYKSLMAHWDTLRDEAVAVVARREGIRDMLRDAGGPITPADMGISAADTLDALRFAQYVRPRFTIQRLASVIGVLDKLAEDVLSMQN